MCTYIIQNTFNLNEILNRLYRQIAEPDLNTCFIRQLSSAHKIAQMAEEWTGNITSKSGLVRTLKWAIKNYNLTFTFFRSEDIRLTCNVHLLVNLPKQSSLCGTFMYH
jgi:hypothetical protein